jgi:hypothetical protein
VLDAIAQGKKSYYAGRLTSIFRREYAVAFLDDRSPSGIL